MTFNEIWFNKWNLIRQVFEAFVCEKKNGDSYKSFSIKKFIAMIFTGLCIHSNAVLIFDTANHWAAKLSSLGVPEAIIITMIASVNVLFLGSLSIYGWSKAKNAA